MNPIDRHEAIQSALLEGEKRPDLAAHVAGCRECRDLEAALKVIDRAIAGLPPRREGVPEGLQDTLLRRIERVRARHDH